MQRFENSVDSSDNTLPSTSNRGDTPPWLRKNPINLTKTMRAYALPNRANPGEPLQLDADTEWQTFAASVNVEANSVLFEELIIADSADAMHKAGQQAIERTKTAQRAGNVHSEAVLLALCCTSHSSYTNPLLLSRYLLAQYGLLKALEILVLAEQINIEEKSTGKWVSYHNGARSTTSRIITLSQTIGDTLRKGEFTQAELFFRTALAQATPEEWQQAATQLQAALQLLHPARRVLLAVLLPEIPELANQLAHDVHSDHATLSWLATVVTSPEARDKIISNSRRNDGYGYWWCYQHQFASTVIQQHGTDASALLSHFIENDGVADMLARIGTPESIRALAHASDGGKAKLQRFAKACERWPLAAIAALAEMLVKAGRHEKARYHTQLSSLLLSHATEVAKLQPWLEPAAWQVISDLQAELAQQAVSSAAINSMPAEPAPEQAAQAAQTTAPDPQASSLPAVLVSPPWLAKKKPAIGPLKLDVLPLEPIELWAEGERERALAHRQSQLDEVRPTPENFPRKLLRYWGSAEQQYREFVEVAQQAIAANDAAGLSAASLAFITDKSSWTYQIAAFYLALLPKDLALAVWPTFATIDDSPGDFCMAYFGLNGLDGLLAAVEHHSENGIKLAQHFGWTVLAPIITQAYIKIKTARTNARNWLLKFPEHAITGLLPAALGKAGTARDNASNVLRLLASQGHTDLIRQVAARYGQKEVDLAVQAMLDADPLDCFPARISKAPSFWAPQACPRPLLLDGMPLPDSALEHLGSMLRFPTSEGVYPGIEQVKAACQRESLAAFAWQAFQQWEYAGAPSKDNWAFTALGLLGTDETVRQLVSLIRVWPTEGLLARAQSGLDVLVRIGSNYALLQLNGVAQKVKSKPLQLAAQEKMQELADNAGLTADELAERITPDLGLDAEGGLTLNFGPRHFRIGFNELLKPVVFDSDNKRLADLPKPNGSDNEYRASEAVRQFKALKRDVKTLAEQTLKRLERAMCQQRQWALDIFESTLVQHPLLRHVVRRLVWAYSAGEHMQTFRVAEDLSYTDASDNTISLPATAVIVLAHPFNLEPATVAAMSQLFADYQLIQPFAQLSREVFRASDADAAVTEALNKAVPTNALRGLESRGWEKGDNFSGEIGSYTTQLSADCHAKLHFEPPYSLAVADKTLRHQLDHLTLKNQGQPVAAAQLDAIILSELLRDLHHLQQ